MKEPVRWTDGGDGLDPGLAGLLRSAQSSRTMSAREYSRTWRKIRILVALGPAAGILLWVKASLAALALVLVGAAAFYGVRHVGSPSKGSPLAAPSFRAVAPPAECSALSATSTEAPDAGPETVAPRLEGGVSSESELRPQKSANVQAAPATSADSFEQELALVERARSLAGSNPGEAQRLLREHGVRFPRGALAMEREMVMIEVLMHSGRRAEARSKAESMLKSAKASLYQKRLENLLQQMQ